MHDHHINVFICTNKAPRGPQGARLANQETLLIIVHGLQCSTVEDYIFRLGRTLHTTLFFSQTDNAPRAPQGVRSVNQEHTYPLVLL